MDIGQHSLAGYWLTAVFPNAYDNTVLQMTHASSITQAGL